MALRPLQQACLDTYVAACDIIPHDLRHAFILIGGAGTIAHGAPERLTEDTDIIANRRCMELLDDAAVNCRGGFHKSTDGESILWDKLDRQGNFLFEVQVELLELGGQFVQWVPSVVSFRNGYVAALPELVRLRAVTVVDRGRPRDEQDLKLLLEMTARRGLKLADVDPEELGILLEAVGLLGCEASEGHFISILPISTLRRWGINLVECL